MAVGLSPPTELYPVAGVRLAAAAAGIRYADRPDLALIELTPGSHSAAVFTRNAFCAAPVVVARGHLAARAPRFLLVNAGNANAGTGQAGIEAALACTRAVAALGECPSEAVLPFSTGVIGETLAVGRIAAALPKLYERLDAAGWRAAAEAIRTTDTVAKAQSRRLRLNGQSITVTGIAKGAGMIRPDMATMLAFVATDAGLPCTLLHECLQAAVARSFHRISVDGDTSSNDACVLVATGSSGMTLASKREPAYARLAEAVAEIMTELAQAIVRDGEGATKLITVAVRTAANEAEARRVAFTIAHSPLVKTACFASDPNWGRILAAVGRAGVDTLDMSRVGLRLGDLCVIRDGVLDAGYTEAAGRRAMTPPEITIGVGLDRGEAACEVWTCDLSHEYVRINAEYRS